MPRKTTARTDSKVRGDGCLGAAEFSTALAQKWKQSREKAEPVSLLLLEVACRCLMLVSVSLKGPGNMGRILAQVF